MALASLEDLNADDLPSISGFQVFHKSMSLEMMILESDGDDAWDDDDIFVLEIFIDGEFILSRESLLVGLNLETASESVDTSSIKHLEEDEKLEVADATEGTALIELHNCYV